VFEPHAGPFATQHQLDIVEDKLCRQVNQMQVQTQRFCSVTTDELTRIRSQEDGSVELKARVDDLSRYVKGMSDQLQAQAGRCASLDKRFADWSRLIDGSLESQQVEVERITNAQVSLLQRVAQSEQSIGDCASKLVQHLKAASEHNASVDGRMDFMEKAFGDAESHESLVQRLDHLQRACSDLSQKRNADLKLLQQKHGELASAFNMLTSSVDDSSDQVKTQIDALKASHGSHRDDVDRRLREYDVSIGDAAEKIANEELQRAYAVQDDSAVDVNGLQVSMTDRVAELEKFFGDCNFDKSASITTNSENV